MVQIILTGPTASGKGSVAFELAKRMEASIACMDSMKIYREMDIVTAKPPQERRDRCQYHLIDLIEPEESFSVGRYLPLLEGLLESETAAGRPVGIAGGTGLYLKGFLDGLVQGPGANWELRDRLTAEARESGSASLYARLQEVDPVAAAKLLPSNERRIIRALEFFESSGQPLGDSWEWKGSPRPREDTVLFGLGWEREALYARANERVLAMVEQGLFAECEGLLSREPPPGRSASQCIGLREIREGLEAGDSRGAIIETIQKNTRNFIKRQLTWFRKMDVEWLPAGGELEPARVAEAILARLA
ncbi:MAG: tRNA (adenosine(37)-N6)-dimethylallyltransferase MiaA [Planctomycetota bacterium]|nr:tRNA (adenosine(37)-N6)-dimethylallyltransferase MiaA [Planctomycetota bacterium]